MSDALTLGGDESRHDRRSAARDALTPARPCDRPPEAGRCRAGLVLHVARFPDGSVHSVRWVACACPLGDVWPERALTPVAPETAPHTPYATP